MLYPFDFRAFGSSAQGDCSCEVRALFRAFVLFLFHATRRAFFIFLTIVRSLDFARDDQREGLAIRIAFFLLMKTVTLSERSESNGYNLGEVKY